MVDLEPVSRRWVEGEIERLGREAEERDLESREEPRRDELRLVSLPRVKLLGNSRDSSPDITAAIALRPCLSRGCTERFRDARSVADGDTLDFTSSCSPDACPVDARRPVSRVNWSDDLRGRSSAPALGRSGELGAEAMAEDAMRRGDEMSG